MTGPVVTRDKRRERFLQKRIEQGLEPVELLGPVGAQLGGEEFLRARQVLDPDEAVAAAFLTDAFLIHLVC
jgi:hypothetical protein